MENLKLKPKTIIIIAIAVVAVLGAMIYDMTRNNGLLNNQNDVCNGKVFENSETTICE